MKQEGCQSFQDDGGGPDDFELQLGNQIAYSIPLWQTNDRFAQLRVHWLPYYSKEQSY